MLRTRFGGRILSIIAGIACLSGIAIPTVHAKADPIERVLSTPTEWFYYYGITPSKLSSVIATGYRIVDLQVESAAASGPVFTVALVANSSAYAKGWWWYYGQSIAEVSAKLSANNARLISIAPYTVNGTTYFASVMVPNTGADAKSWYWWVGTASQIESYISATTARLVDVEPYTTSAGTRYAAIAIGNSGADADEWWWYLGDSLSGLENHLSTNGAQLLTFNKGAGASTFDSTMQHGATAAWWYYTGINAATLNQLVFENGARLTQLRSVLERGHSRTFNAVMINNSNTCTSRLIALQHANGTGWNGNYVKEISGSAVTNGPVPCAANDARPFEPASAIKVVLATYAMYQVQLKNESLTEKVPLFDPTNFCNLQQVGTETLGDAITQMMENSDNARTDMLLKRYGLATVTSYAHTLGMTNTAFNGYIDCPNQAHNTLTLDDAALLYTGLVEHTVLNAASVTKLFGMMAGRHYDFAGMWADMQPIIKAVAPASLPTAKLNSFIAGIKLSYKSGGYTWPGGIPDLNGQTEYGDVGIDGSISLPTCAGTTKAARHFVFGFFHESTASDADQTPLFNKMGAGAELLREQIRQSLANWSACG